MNTLNALKNSIFLPSLIAFILTFIVTPFVIKFAKKAQLVDDPEKRIHPAHTQKRIVPRAGGLALFIGIIIPILLFLPLNKHYFGIIIGSVIILIIGLLDDKYDLNPIIRLISNFLVAMLIVGSGIGISYITNPFGGIINLDQIKISFDFFGPHTIVLIADFFALIWIVWTMNMLNWSKGVDGQMPLIVIVASITIGLLSLRFINYEPQQIEVAQIAFIIASSTLAFLFFNWHPSLIFPGYSATILGYILAALSILTGAKVATAILVLGIPSIDALFTVIRRIYQKKSPFKGDRGHLHHRLLDQGWSHQKISLFYFLLCAILGAFALNLSSEQKLFAILVVGIIFIGGVIWLAFSLELSNRSDPGNGSKI